MGQRGVRVRQEQIDANGPGSRRLIVGLHDVAPPFEPQIRAQLEALSAIGVRRCVLKVVPNWHGSSPITQAASFLDLLHEQVAAGSELVLHGFEHRPRGTLRGPLLRRLRGTLFAAQAAEFLTLTPAEAERAIGDGMELFERAGLPRPDSFCAPGWLITSEAEAAVARAGIRCLISMFSVYDLAAERRQWTPGFGYMGASPGQEAGVQILNGIVRRTVLPHARVVKVFLHPQGYAESGAARGVMRALAEMVSQGGWQMATYREVYDGGD